MFSNGDLTIREAAEQLLKAQDETGFKIAIRDLKRCFKQLEIKSEYLMEIERRAYYLSNEYSEKDTRE